MTVWFIWLNCKFIGGVWGDRAVDSFWVECDLEETDGKILPLLPVQQRAGVLEEVRERGRGGFLLARDLSGACFTAHNYPVSNLWNAYSPFHAVLPTEITDLAELATLKTTPIDGDNLWHEHFHPHLAQGIRDDLVKEHTASVRRAASWPGRFTKWLQGRRLQPSPFVFRDYDARGRGRVVAPSLQDRIWGIVFGHAIGDALGLGTEFMAKSDVRQHYPEGLRHYGQIIRDGHRGRWAVGAWTDDTDQMLCILDSLLAKRGVHPADIAARLHRWAAEGGMGIGQTTWRVVHDRDFLADPHAVSRRVWEQSGRQSAANGAIMRTSILGAWDFHDPARVQENAEQVCRLTHFDPRCVGSCVMVCLLISNLMRGVNSVPRAIHEARQVAETYDPAIKHHVAMASCRSLYELHLDRGLNPGEPDEIGYTLKAMAAGLWAVRHAASYAEGVLSVIHEGGDADTNAAVAGGLLGALFGFTGIPPEWVTGLARPDELRIRAQRMVRLVATTAGGLKE